MERDMAFFKGVSQVETQFNGEAARIPVFYYDLTAITAIFPAKLSALRRFMPKKEFHPSPIFPGIGAIAITCFEYRDTDIRPYNEISVAIPMTYRKRSCLPGAALLSSMRNNEFHAFVHRLPVTTEIALAGGVDVYNFPKFMSTIEFQDTGDATKVSLAEKGETIFTVTADKIPANEAKKLRFVTYPVKEGNAQHSDVLMNVKKFGQTYSGQHLRLELGGNHPIARELKGALLRTRPILYQYLPEAQAILYGPSRLE